MSAPTPGLIDIFEINNTHNKEFFHPLNVDNLPFFVTLPLHVVLQPKAFLSLITLFAFWLLQELRIKKNDIEYEEEKKTEDARWKANRIITIATINI